MSSTQAFEGVERKREEKEKEKKEEGEGKITKQEEGA
jgi:hypothetical protein